MTEQAGLKTKASKSQHPFMARAFHSINIFAVILMAASGMQIYNANPVFGGRGGWTIPSYFVLGGWLAGGRHWHFAVMWLFFLNLAVYLSYVLLSKRWSTRFANKSDVDSLFDVNVSSKRRIYGFHRILYSTVVPLMVLALLSGIAMYKPVQFDWLANLPGSWQNLRIVHFATIPFVIIFTVLHSGLGLKVGGWRLLRSIFFRGS